MTKLGPEELLSPAALCSCGLQEPCFQTQQFYIFSTYLIPYPATLLVSGILSYMTKNSLSLSQDPLSPPNDRRYQQGHGKGAIQAWKLGGICPKLVMEQALGPLLP